MWRVDTAVHSSLDLLPNDWMLRRAAPVGRRAARARIVAINVGQLVLRTEFGDRMEVAT